jgi:hypothetical protein
MLRVAELGEKHRGRQLGKRVAKSEHEATAHKG